MPVGWANSLPSSQLRTELVKIRCRGLGGSRQHLHVGADGHEIAAQRECPLCVVVIRSQEARRFASGTDALEGVGDLCLHLWVARVADVAHGGGEVAGPDEKRIDAV